MDNLKDLSERLKYEINPLLEKKKEEKETDKDKDSSVEGAYEYRSTASETKGRVRTLSYDINYKELSEFLEKEVSNISWTVPKARQTFKAIRKYLGFQKEKE